LRKRLNALVGFLFGTLFNSHESPFERRGFVVRAVFVVTHDAARFFFKGSCDTWQEKSDLPKNSTICPINQGECGVIGQSHRTVAIEELLLFDRIDLGHRRIKQ